MPFRIVAISHIWGDAFGDDTEGSVRLPEAAWGRSDRRGAAKLLPGRIDLAAGTPSKKARLTKATKALQLVERSALLQPPIRQINPGQTLSFSVGPVDNTTLFRGDDALQLEVPEDATRVSVTLESDADVALLVRYGEDIELQDGSPIFDYDADEVLAGTEEVVITSDSDPPLRAGTYFIGIVVVDTGVVVNCKLTADVEREGGTSPPTEDNTLTPGQPVSFQRGPVDTPDLFARNDSFLLEVPEDATRVTFTLESDVDVELLVRFGEDNDVQDRMIVTDNRSRIPAGNERILVTPRSNPPLRAGTYFVSVAVWATGVVANCTLTAEVELDEEDQTPISGGTLMPGQPADFRLGPVDSPTLFIRHYSFRLDVPDNASRITFTLASVDPDVDLALSIRYGENIEFQGGRWVFHHVAWDPTGNERIGITQRSDPPLRAGTYFASVAVFTTDVVAEGTLTATVETDAEDCHLDVTCYPEWSRSANGVALIVFERSEGSGACSGTLINNRQRDFAPYFLTAAH